MEQIKETWQETGNSALETAQTLVQSTAEEAANMLGRAAGHAVAFITDRVGTLTRAISSRTKDLGRDHRETLVMLAAVISGAVLVASLLGVLLARKK